MKIGWDIDGVLCKIDLGFLAMLNRWFGDREQFEEIERFYYQDRKPELDARLFMLPEDEMLVITCRNERIRTVTLEWLIKHYPTAKAYFLPVEAPTGDNKNEWIKTVAKIKAEAINELGMEVYFEDETAIVRLLRKFCPNTKIIQYGGRL